jgi:hypothetical protein
MSFGERAAIEGLLAQLRPQLAIEIGTAEGGSLSRIAAHSDHVISFDLVEPEERIIQLPNVELRTGDSHRLLPEELGRLTEAGKTVDFVLVDGDHSAEGAHKDMEDLLASDCLRRTIILAHDSLNPEVRRGLEAVPYDEIEKVSFVDLDFVSGYVPEDPPLRGECWGGLALIVVDASGGFKSAHGAGRTSMVPLPELIWDSAEALKARGEPHGGSANTDVMLQDEADHYRRLAQELQGSLSWRITAPLRGATQRIRRRRAR